MGFPNHFMLFVCLFSFHSYSSQADENAATIISHVCPKVKDPDFCKTTLGLAPPDSDGALRGLVSYILDKSYKAAENNSDAVGEMLIRASKDPEYTQVLNQCKLNYNDSIDTLQKSAARFHVNDFAFVKAQAGVVTNYTKNCDHDLTDYLHAISPLADRNGNDRLLQLSEIYDILVPKL